MSFVQHKNLSTVPIANVAFPRRNEAQHTHTTTLKYSSASESEMRNPNPRNQSESTNYKFVRSGEKHFPHTYLHFTKKASPAVRACCRLERVGRLKKYKGPDKNTPGTLCQAASPFSIHATIRDTAIVRRFGLMLMSTG
jgi:hypothetical protein